MTWSSAKPGVWAPGTAPAAPQAQVRWAPEDLASRPSPVPPPAIVEAAAAPDPHEAMIAEAYAQGFDDGRLEGEQGEQARLRTAVAAAQEALDAIRDGEQRWSGTIEENICALAIAVARHVIGREVTTDRAIIADLVRKAVSDFGVDRQVRVRVHPQDLALLTGHGADDDDHADRLAAGRDMRWIPDVGVGRGSCVVEGRERIVDGRVDVALERVYRRLTYTHA
jgi:flagellar biosynthesis/type III secretory pathway protein FliH